MAAGATAAVLAIGVAVRIFGHILITVVLPALVARSQLHHPDVLPGRVVAVLASQPTRVRWGAVFFALARVTLPPLDSLYVLHDQFIRDQCAVGNTLLRKPRPAHVHISDRDISALWGSGNTLLRKTTHRARISRIVQTNCHNYSLTEMAKRPASELDFSEFTWEMVFELAGIKLDEDVAQR